jgi:hypothetical protein
VATPLGRPASPSKWGLDVLRGKLLEPLSLLNIGPPDPKLGHCLSVDIGE